MAKTVVSGVVFEKIVEERDWLRKRLEQLMTAYLKLAKSKGELKWKK